MLLDCYHWLGTGQLRTLSSNVPAAHVTGVLQRERSVPHLRLAHFSTAMEAIQARSDPLAIDEDDIPYVLPTLFQIVILSASSDGFK